MKRPLKLLLFFLVVVISADKSVFAQATCSFIVSMGNHNRYAYDTAEECWPNPHSVPFGNWGVSSNVGQKEDGHQFRGWHPQCNVGSELVQWNSCSVDYVKPDLDCQRLNFPDPAGLFQYPANNYPFSDPFLYNNSVPPYGNSRCVDQFSPCGANVYGYASVTVGVSPQVDNDSDGIADAGGCMNLDGWWAGVQQNFMTVYEMDPNGGDDVVESLYYPDTWVQLVCTPDACFAVGDADFNEWIDDNNDQSSPDYKWPTMYQDNDDVICYPTDPNVPCKRIDATVKIVRVAAYYAGPTPWQCSAAAESDCINNQGGDWDPNTCTCHCSTSGGSWMCEIY